MLQSQQNGFTHKGDKNLAGEPSIMICIYTGLSEIFFSAPCSWGNMSPPILASWEGECLVWEMGLDSEDDHSFTSSVGLSTWKFFLILKLYNDAYIGFSALNVLTEWTDEEVEADDNGFLDSPSQKIYTVSTVHWRIWHTKKSVQKTSNDQYSTAKKYTFVDGKWHMAPITDSVVMVDGQ